MAAENETKANEVKIDEEFTKKALNEIDFTEKEQKIADYNRDGEKMAEQSSEYWANQEKEAEAWQNKHYQESSALRTVNTFMKFIEASDPELAKQSNLYLNNLVNKDDFEIRRDLRNNKSSKNVDLDGSKKTFFGRMKNKIRNLWYPNNAKKTLEEAISKLRDDMAKNPEFYESLKRNVAKGEKVTFKDIVGQNEKDSTRYNDERVKAMLHKEKQQKWSNDYKAKAQSHEAVIDAIASVKDKAAKEVELKMQARENVGIKDAAANTGVDKLAERAKAMEGMSPEQRVAYRISVLRGTVKETPNPVQKREISANTLAQVASKAKTNS